MNYLLHRQRSPGAIVSIPEDLEELMAEISREVLRSQPGDVIGFVADYLEEKLVRRENRRLAEKVVDNVLDFSLDIVAMLEAAGIDAERAEGAMRRIREEFHRHFETKPDDERLRDVFRERDVLERLVKECHFSEQEARKASAIIEQAYRTYYFRNAYNNRHPPAKDKDWRQAAKHSLSIYAQSGPTKEEMEAAAGRIQSAYRAYYTRKRKLMDQQATIIQRAFRSHRNRKSSDHMVRGSASVILTHEKLGQDEPILGPGSTSSYVPIDDILCLINDTIGEGAEQPENVVETEPTPLDADKAATLIQSVFRAHQRRIQIPRKPAGANAAVNVDAHQAATLLQSTFRGHSARKKRQQETTHHQMATLLQSHARGYLARKRHSRNNPDASSSSPENRLAR